MDRIHIHLQIFLPAQEWQRIHVVYDSMSQQ
jgi:hypothetical protein